MKIQSKRFQTELQFDDTLVIHMPQGLLGFPESKKFCILELDFEGSPFKWFHDIDDTSIALLITDPYQFFPDYHPEVNQKHLNELEVKNVEEDLMLFTIVKVSKGGREAFTNLRAPVIVNATTKVAKQIILESDEYSVKTAIFREEEGVKKEAAAG
jgi:flagellar assembly factor FliW